MKNILFSSAHAGMMGWGSSNWNGPAYSGCWSDFGSAPFGMPMMRYGFHGFGVYSNWIWFPMTILFWTLAVFALVVCIRSIRGK